MIDTNIKIAAILTCHNRINKTEQCLLALFKALDIVSEKISLHVFLTDDGSVDGTKDMLQRYFPDVEVVTGDGNLFWARGMNMSWLRALRGNFDYFLLLNDDTEVSKHLFEEFEAMHNYCFNKYHVRGAYVGAVSSLDDATMTYGGNLITNKYSGKYKKCSLGENFTICDLANTNIFFVSVDIVKEIGIFDSHYHHGSADFDYSLIIKKKGYPLLMSSHYLGRCNNDHCCKNAKLLRMNIVSRFKYLFNPVGLGFLDLSYYYIKNFPAYFLVFLLSTMFKILFPGIYCKLLGRGEQ